MILAKMRTSTPTVLLDLIQVMHKVANNFYYIPGTADTLTNIGIFFQEIKDYETAIHYYEKAIQYFGQTEAAHYNRGLCLFFLERWEEALNAFQSTLTLSKDNVVARGWVAKILDEKYTPLP